MKGFTLLETIVAVTVLITVLTGAATLSQQSLRAAADFKENLVAASLAQEGVELVRYRRDSNRFSGENWMDGIIHPGDLPCGKDRGCIAEIDTADGDATFSKCKGTSCTPLRFDSATGVYAYETGSGSVETSLVRTIHVKEIVPDQEVKVEVNVEWRSLYGGTKSLAVEERLLDWQ